MGKTERVVIGIVPSFDEGDGVVIFPGPKTERVYLRTEYMRVLASVGAVPLILSPDMPLEMVAELCDGVVISGGFDIDASAYGEERLGNEPLEPMKRFMWEERLIDTCDKTKIPIFGICYGMQRLNIYYGGSLFQDIPTAFSDALPHMESVHTIEFYESFLGLDSGALYSINSRHHQAINVLADGFSIAAAAPDGIIEAIKGRGHFGVQWHPESDETGVHMYRAFVEHCKKL
jgi:putative glutamine amidotransferase